MKLCSDGSPAYPHLLQKASDAPLAVPILRQALASQKDGSAVVIAIGPLTNLGNLLGSTTPPALQPNTIPWARGSSFE